VRLLVRYHPVENFESYEGKRGLGGLVLEGGDHGEIVLYFFKSRNLVRIPVGAE
jgi:hypothetical protein